jgi:polynucleotide 5'-kinase involved in rRNA processing
VKKSKDEVIKVPVVSPKGSREERKELLQESANKYLEAIETQIGDLKKVGQNTLIIGGVIVAAYAITELLLPAPRQKRTIDTVAIDEVESEGESIVWAALKGAATSLLLTVAKDKLLGLMDNLSTKDAEPNS